MEELRMVKLVGIYGEDDELCQDSDLEEHNSCTDDEYASDVNQLPVAPLDTTGSSPLFFVYDCEGTGGVIYTDHIVEIAAAVQPLPAGK